MKSKPQDKTHWDVRRVGGNEWAAGDVHNLYGFRPQSMHATRKEAVAWVREQEAKETA